MPFLHTPLMDTQIAKDIYSTLNFGHKGWFSVEVGDWWYINIESTLYCDANLMIEISMFNQHLIYAGGGGEAPPSSHPPSSHLMIEISTLNQCLINVQVPEFLAANVWIDWLTLSANPFKHSNRQAGCKQQFMLLLHRKVVWIKQNGINSIKRCWTNVEGIFKGPAFL